MSYGISGQWKQKITMFKTEAYQLHFSMVPGHTSVKQSIALENILDEIKRVEGEYQEME